MKSEIKMSDLSQIGINERLLTNCFAQKGISINCENLDWVKKSSSTTIEIDLKSTCPELSETYLCTDQSFGSNQMICKPDDVSINEESSNDSFEIFQKRLLEFKEENFVETQTLICEFSEKLFQQNRFSDFKRTNLLIQNWMNIYEKVFPLFYFYIKINFSFYIFKSQQSVENYLCFQRNKSTIFMNHTSLKSQNNNQCCLISFDKLFHTLESLDQSFSRIIQNNDHFNERYVFCDFSHSSHIKEVHLTEVVKIKELFLGNSHVVWSCFDERNLFFGIGDNSHGQINPGIEPRFFSRPILINEFLNKGIKLMNVHLDNTFAIDESNIYLWGKSFEKTMVKIKEDFSGKINSIHFFDMNFVYFMEDNSCYSVLINQQQSNMNQSSFNASELENEKDSSLKKSDQNFHEQIFISKTFRFTKKEMTRKLVAKIKTKRIEVSVGSNHLMVLTNEGEIYAYGSNNHHQISEDKNRDFEKGLMNIESPSSEKIIKVFCLCSLTIMIDSNFNFFVFGKINNKKEIRFPENFELSLENDFGNKMTREDIQNIQISGNEKKIVVFIRDEVLEWSTESSFKFKKKQNENKIDLTLFMLGKTFELYEKRCVFAPNCELFIDKEKLLKSESVKCTVILRDAENKPFISNFEKETIGILMAKNEEMINHEKNRNSNLNTFILKNDKIEIRNYGKIDLSIFNLNFISFNQFSFEIKCKHVGLYFLQLFCGRKQLKNEFIIEILGSNDGEDYEKSLDNQWNGFLTSSSFKTSNKTEDKLNQTSEKMNGKTKLIPMQSISQVSSISKQKVKLIRFSSIKKTENEKNGRSILEDKFPSKIHLKLSSFVETNVKLKSDKLIFKKK
jgi:alpha-tubulin suppressor-like RCC1 family protein